MEYSCLGLASGLGAGKPGCGEGPLFLMEHLSKERYHWEAMVVPKEVQGDKCDQIAQLNTEYARQVFQVAKRNRFFLTFGGDHSAAIGMWSGVAEAIRDRGDLGLIWIDAHMDAHTHQTSPSGNIHGMPLASLLGYGDKRLSTILSTNPKIKPENLILIGIRDYEQGEADLLKSLNVKIYFIEEVHKRGFNTVLKEAITAIAPRTAGYGVSFDVDVIDPSEVYATGTPVPNGISSQEAFKALAILKSMPPLAFELVEYNPSLDNKKETFSFIEGLLNILTTNGVLK